MEWFFWIIVIGLAWISSTFEPSSSQVEDLFPFIVLFWGIVVRIAIAFFRWSLWGGRDTERYKIRKEAALKETALIVIGALAMMFFLVIIFIFV